MISGGGPANISVLPATRSLLLPFSPTSVALRQVVAVVSGAVDRCQDLKFVNDLPIILGRVQFR